MGTTQGWYEFRHQDIEYPDSPSFIYNQGFLLRKPEDLGDAIQCMVDAAPNQEWKEQWRFYDSDQQHWTSHGKQPLAVLPTDWSSSDPQTQALFKGHWITALYRNPLCLIARGTFETTDGEIESHIAPDLEVRLYPSTCQEFPAALERARDTSRPYTNLGLGIRSLVMPTSLVEQLAEHDWTQYAGRMQAVSDARKRRLLHLQNHSGLDIREIKANLN